MYFSHGGLTKTDIEQMTLIERSLYMEALEEIVQKLTKSLQSEPQGNIDLYSPLKTFNDQFKSLIG